MTKKALLVLIALICSAALVSAASPQQDSNAVMVAYVSIYDPAIESQSGNKLKITFELYNRQGIQPGVKYGVLLTERGQNAIADQHIYEDVLTLGENETRDVAIEYTAPSFLGGEYDLQLISANERGLLLAQMPVGTITLPGGGEKLELSASKCSMHVGDEEKTYGLRSGIAISAGEELKMTCTIRNPLTQATGFTPLLRTYERSLFGAFLSERKLQSSTIPANAEMDFTFPLPIETKPQAYDIEFSLVDSQGMQLSNPVYPHYVVSGASGTIQNVVFDKDYYVSGDTAHVLIFWSPSADLSPLSRINGTRLTEPNLEISVTGLGEACSTTLKTAATQGVFDLAVPITSDCWDPSLQVRLLDGQQELDKRVFATESENLPQAGLQPQANVPEEPPATGDNTMLYAIAAVLILLVFVIIYKKKWRTNC